MPNFLVGGDPELFSNPNAGGTQGAIAQLSNSNFGAQGAQNAERGIGRRYQDQIEGIESNPSFGRNAAVSSRLTDLAASQAGESTANAYESGARTDANARVQGAQLSMQAGEQARQDNELNYQRKQDASFGNSFLGHVLEAGVGGVEGALTGGLSEMLAPKTAAAGKGGRGKGINYDSDYSQNIGDSSFGKGAVKAIIGKDGTKYIPRSDDDVVVGTNLGVKKTDTTLAAGQLRIGDTPHRLQWDQYKLGHAAFDYSG